MSFDWINEGTISTLAAGYIPKSFASGSNITKDDVIKWLRIKADHAEALLRKEGYADKLMDYLSRGWISLSSPLWSNYGNSRGWPVSCFGSRFDDTMGSILFGHAENGMLMKLGGGTSGFFALRPVNAPLGSNEVIDYRKTYTRDDVGPNGQSKGLIHFLDMFETEINIVSQGAVRRGFFSAYIDIDHAELEDFLHIGTEKSDIQIMTTGVCVSDEFLQKVEDGDREAKNKMAKLIQARDETGAPYIIYTGNMNGKTKPECYKDDTIMASNMCTEIALPATSDETFVCVLASLNLKYWDDWKDTDLVETMIEFLDSVCTDTIIKYEGMDDSHGKQLLVRPYNFLKNHRALGLGVLGWATYLQEHMIPFESKEAAQLNYNIFKTMREKAEKASIKLGEEFGCVKGTNRRNTTLLAVAPTKTSSYILGQASQGIEPIWSNYHIDEKAKTKSVFKNPALVDYLQSVGMDTPEVWRSILIHDGSVQQLDWMDAHVKDVFKTFGEIPLDAVLYQAAARQEFIDQAQSLNLMIDPDMTPREKLHEIYLKAWKLGIKSLYYQYSINAAQALARKKMQGECTSCHA